MCHLTGKLQQDTPNQKAIGEMAEDLCKHLKMKSPSPETDSTTNTTTVLPTFPVLPTKEEIAKAEEMEKEMEKLPEKPKPVVVQANIVQEKIVQRVYGGIRTYDNSI